MADDNKLTSPYREGVRIEPTNPAEPLPDFLTVRYDELVARHKEDWEAHVRPPAWWVKHVDRHTLPRDYGEANKKVAPSPNPFRNSVVWTLIVATIVALTYVLASRDGEVNAARTAKWALGIVLILSTGLSVVGSEEPLWSLKHVGLLPVSLWLTLKELVAWLVWKHDDRRWSLSDWYEERATSDIARTFRDGPMKRHTDDLADLRKREQKCRTEANAAKERIRRHENDRERLDAKAGIIAEQLTRAIEIETERLKTLTLQADRVATLATDGELRLKALEGHVTTYEELQKSRQRLRQAKSLDDDDTKDLEQREIVRNEHLKIRGLLNQVETVFQGPPKRTTATDEDELSAQINAAAARTAARP